MLSYRSRVREHDETIVDVELAIMLHTLGVEIATEDFAAVICEDEHFFVMTDLAAGELLDMTGCLVVGDCVVGTDGVCHGHDFHNVSRPS